VTEVIQDNFDLIDAFCVDAGSLAEPEVLRSRINAEGDIVGELDGDSVSFPVEANNAYICFFTNSPEPEDSCWWRDRDPGDHPPADGCVRWTGGSDQRVVADHAGRDGRHPRQRPDPDPEPGDSPQVAFAVPCERKPGCLIGTPASSCPLTQYSGTGPEVPTRTASRAQEAHPCC
jgi:hypothetical protein